MNPLQHTIVRESQDEKNATAPILRRLVGLWLNGGRIFLKWLWFSFCLMILLVPFNALTLWINRPDHGFFKHAWSGVPVFMIWILAILYLPFAGWLASRISRVLFTRWRTE